MESAAVVLTQVAVFIICLDADRGRLRLARARVAIGVLRAAALTESAAGERLRHVG